MTHTPHISITEKFVRLHARRITQDGHVVLSTNGDPLLVEAFAELGWADPYRDPADLKAEAKQAAQETADFKAELKRDAHADAEKTHEYQAAAVEAPERAVMPEPKKHHK
jgi:hypothetical protein